MQKKMIHIVFVIMLVATLLPSSIAGAADEPKDLYYCSYSGCTGYYAPHQDCDDDARNVGAIYIRIPDTVGLNELRYSENCHSYWARTILYESGYYVGTTVDGPTDYSEASPAPLYAQQSIYTRMVTSASATRACGKVDDDHVVDVPVGVWCTIWHTNS